MSTAEVYTGWFIEVIGNRDAEYVPGHLISGTYRLFDDYSRTRRWLDDDCEDWHDMESIVSDHVRSSTIYRVRLHECAALALNREEWILQDEDF